MAVSTLQSNAIGLRPAFAMTPGQPKLMQGRAAASETWIKGAVLIRSSGQLAEASADPTADIVGIAAGDVTSSSANDLVSFYPAFPGSVFEGTLEDESSEDHQLAVADLHTDVGLQVDNDGVWYLDENETSSTAVVIIAPKNDSDVASTTRARVYFTFLHDVTIYNT